MKHILATIAVFGAVTLFVVWGEGDKLKDVDVPTKTATVQEIRQAEADEPNQVSEEDAEPIEVEPVSDEIIDVSQVETEPVTILGRQENHTANIEPNVHEAPEHDTPAESEPPAYTPPAYTPPVETTPPNLVHEGEMNEVIDYGVYCGTCGSLWDMEHNTCPVCFPYTG